MKSATHPGFESPMMRGRLWVYVLLLLFFPALVIAQQQSVEAVQIYEGLRKATSIYATQNHLFIVESGKNRIIKLDHNGKLLETMGGLGSGDYQLDTPVDVDATNGLKIYISDSRNNRIQVFDRRFQYLTSIRAGSEFGSQRPFRPMQLAVNAFGELFFYDEASKSILKYDENGNRIDTFQLEGEIEQVDDFQVIGRQLYIFDTKNRKYHVLSDNGLERRTYPAKEAVSFFVDDKGNEWFAGEDKIFRARDSVTTIQLLRHLSVIGMAKIDKLFFVLTPNSVNRIKKSEADQ